MARAWQSGGLGSVLSTIKENSAWNSCSITNLQEPQENFFICIETMVCDTKIGLCNKNRGNLFCVSGSVFVLTRKICTSGIL